ncbi:MAG: dTMP kinase [Alphaproteobacteria bacterium 41-28]|nr:MAG: dTMP kinase [Alphaproteobacteria bacterium 41-28]
MIKHKAPFITFEGGEGSGKTTQVDILYHKLLQGGIDVVSYREPGGTRGAEEIRHLLMEGERDRWNPKSEALLMSAARADLIDRHIIPRLEADTWVLCDRFTDSTIAYQGFGHELGYEHIQELNHFTVGELEPDLTFIFQISAELGLERTALRKAGIHRFEHYDIMFHRRVAEGFEEILKKNPNRCVAINALLDIEMISEFIYNKICQRFSI